MVYCGIMIATTMKLSLKTKKLLEKRRNYPKEPLEYVVTRLLEYHAENAILTKDEIKDVQQGLEDIKSGRVYTTEQLNKELGL